MIRAHCRTNLDEFKGFEWPNEFVALPRVGDYVQVVGVGYPRKTLRIVSITHGQNDDRVPFIVVELHH